MSYSMSFVVGTRVSLLMVGEHRVVFISMGCSWEEGEEEKERNLRRANNFSWTTNTALREIGRDYCGTVWMFM